RALRRLAVALPVALAVARAGEARLAVALALAGARALALRAGFDAAAALAFALTRAAQLAAFAFHVDAARLDVRVTMGRAVRHGVDRSVAHRFLRFDLDLRLGLGLHVRKKLCGRVTSCLGLFPWAVTLGRDIGVRCAEIFREIGTGGGH